MRPLLAVCVPTLLLLAGCAPDRQPQPPVAAQAPESAEVAAVSGPGWTGLTAPDDVIRARRAVMAETERLIKPIDSYIVGEPADAALLRDNATAIEALLVAVPHLFPPTTNLFDPAAAESPTEALPTIWQRFPAFTTFAANAVKAAAVLRGAQSEADLQAASVRLRGACDACHAGFLKPYTPPQATEADAEFDFDSVLPKN